MENYKKIKKNVFGIVMLGVVMGSYLHQFALGVNIARYKSNSCFEKICFKTCVPQVKMNRNSWEKIVLARFEMPKHLNAGQNMQHRSEHKNVVLVLTLDNGCLHLTFEASGWGEAALVVCWCPGVVHHTWNWMRMKVVLDTNPLQSSLDCLHPFYQQNFPLRKY